MKTILFVCTGNTCRSPMAEGIFNERAKKLGLPYRAASAGMAASENSRASVDAVLAAEKFGADISGHLARNVTDRMIREAVSVYCMTSSHAETLRRIFPEYESKIFELTPGGINDPFMQGLEVYIKTAKQISNAIAHIIPDFER